MNDKFFIDTNIFIYALDDNLSKKHLADEILVRSLNSAQGVISFQVIQEFCNLAIRKFQKSFTADELKDYCREVLYPLCTDRQRGEPRRLQVYLDRRYE